MSNSTSTEDIARFLREVRDDVRNRPARPAFPREEYRRRHQLLQQMMGEAGIDLLLLYAQDAMCWLHGHELRWYKAQSPTVWPPLTCTAVHVDSDQAILFETAEHVELIPERSVIEDVRLCEREDAEGRLDHMFTILKDQGWLQGRVGMEYWSFLPNYAMMTEVQSRLREAGCETTDATLLIRKARHRKSPLEQARMKEAAKVCDKGLLRLQEVLQPGITEKQAWAEMVKAMADAGGDPAALHETVSVGDVHRGHVFSGPRVLQKGDVVAADPCGVIDHYHANVSRTFVVGEVPEVAARIGEIEGGAYDVLCRVATPGTRIGDVVMAMKKYYEDAGIWDFRGQGWLGAYELGVSFAPDWVGEFTWTVGDENDEKRDDVIEEGSVTNYESIIGLPMIDTLIYGADRTYCLSELPKTVLGTS